MSSQLTDAQRTQVEQYMPLVTRVMKECVHGPTGIYDWYDLRQYGYIGLCNAAATYDESRNVLFETYAYMLIHNEIYKALEYATRRKQREITMESENLPQEASLDSDPDTDLITLLDAAAADASGIIAKGIEALLLKSQGYSSKEIACFFTGASDSLVRMWMSRARRYLRQNPAIAAFAP